MRLLFTSLLFCVVQLSFAQFARVQFIHNASDANVDIYVDDNLYANNLVFRTATPYVDVPVGNIQVGIAPANSTSADQATKNITTKLEEGQSYVIMVGIVEKGRPDYEVFISDQVSEFADTGNTVGIAFANGSPETGELDFFWKEFSFSLFDEVAYGEFGPMISLPVGQYDFDVTAAYDNEEVLIANSFNFEWWRGQSLVLFTSGFEGGNPGLKTYVALSNGGTFPLESLPLENGPRMAYAQFIHNASVDNVDIYLNDKKLKNNFVFRTATPFLELAAKQEITVGIAPKNSASVEDVYKKFPMTLEANANYIMMLNGSNSTDISLDVYNNGMQEASANTKVALLFVNGAATTPTVDLLVDGATLHNNVAYGEYTSYFNFAPTTYRFDISDGQEILKSYEAPFSFWKGGSAVVYSSGYIDGSHPTFKLYVALSTGGTFPLAEVEANQIEGRGDDINAPIVRVETHGNVVDDYLKTVIQLPRPANVRLDIVNSAGKPVRNYKLGIKDKGTNSIELDTHDLTNGMYVMHWKVGREVHVQRIVVARY